jgi:hypothetical protein
VQPGISRPRQRPRAEIDSSRIGAACFKLSMPA